MLNSLTLIGRDCLKPLGLMLRVIVDWYKKKEFLKVDNKTNKNF